MALRICLVTPFAWSQPHDVNEHVAGIARELRALGHAVTIIASSNRAAELAAGRVALHNGSFDGEELVILGPAVPISRRSRVGVPVGVRTNLSRALRFGRFDVVHGFEPGLPSLSYLALRDAESLAVATFFSPERLSYPPGRAQRERLLGRIDQLLAASEDTAAAAAVRFPGAYRILSEGVDTTLFEPAEKERRIVLEWRPTERPLTRAVLHTLGELPDWRLTMLRTKPLTTRPYVPRTLAGRVDVRTARDSPSRAAILNGAAIFVPAAEGISRLALEAAAAGAAVASPPGLQEQPQLAAAEMGRLADDESYRVRRAAGARGEAERQTFMDVAHELEAIYEDVRTRKRSARRETEPLGDRDWIVVDLHMHTSASHDCRVAPELLLEHALAEGLGAIAITDHNVFSGAQEVSKLARGRDIVVIPAEEVKTDGQGEVIGLFLKEEIPRGMSFGDTIAAIKAQGGLVYVPHPFDRMHAIPDPATLHDHLSQIDVFEVYNARLLFETYNDEALRFARKYNLTMGAGSDAHVLQGVGTGAVRMRAFDGPEEFLLSLRTAEILRRPKSLLYLQSLKWAAQAKERVR
ncbi:MAG: CehA/McbA family metallohydrolase [Gaiellaceae bacterium]|jgi:predicted metal-dependent phosphoesterase TrpH